MKKHLPRPWPNPVKNLVQSLLVAGYIFLVFFCIFQLHAKLAVACLAASAFIAFGFPQAESARTRYFIGGYTCGILCGGAFAYLLKVVYGSTGPSPNILILFCSLAVLFAAFIMFSFHLQHPPAAAVSISLLTEEDPLLMGVSLFVCILLLCGLKYIARKFLGKYFILS